MHAEPTLRSVTGASQRLAPISVECRVAYRTGPPELRRWTLLQAAENLGAGPGSTWVCQGVESAGTVEWAAPVDATLETRCREILSRHLFDTVAMPPRIVGLPLWASLAVSMCYANDIHHSAELEMHLTALQRAVVRRRALDAAAWQQVQVGLRPCDADPLRAMLSIGLCAEAPGDMPPPPKPRRAAARVWANQWDRLGARPIALPA